MWQPTTDVPLYCNRCKQHLDPHAFSPANRRPDKRPRECRECKAARANERRKTDAFKEYSRTYHRKRLRRGSLFPLAFAVCQALLEDQRLDHLNNTVRKARLVIERAKDLDLI